MLRLKPLGHLSNFLSRFTIVQYKLRFLSTSAEISRIFFLMTRYYKIHVYNRQAGTEHTATIPDDQYILQSLEEKGIKLPFSCRNGACTTCAVRRIEGEIYHPEAMGLSPQLEERGYNLLCVGYPRSDLVVETQDEDEVYEQQFGRYFGKGKILFGIPLDDD